MGGREKSVMNTRFFFISMIRCVVIFSLMKNIKEEKQVFGKRQEIKFCTCANQDVCGTCKWKFLAAHRALKLNQEI